MYREHIIPRKMDAAVCAEMKESIFVHRSNGRQSAAYHQKSGQFLTEEEEDVLVWRYKVLQHAGFAQTLKDITTIAEDLEILRKRVPHGIVSLSLHPFFPSQWPPPRSQWPPLLFPPFSLSLSLSFPSFCLSSRFAIFCKPGRRSSIYGVFKS